MRLEMMEVELETGCLDEMKAFYIERLEMALLEETADSFVVAAGASQLRFTKGAGHPFYHFAFNIPENKIAEAKSWLEGRVELIEEEGDTLVFFPHWNAHSLYFCDPAGNIVEFIARHNLANRAAGEFTPTDILCVSEIGMPVDDVMDTIEKMQMVFNLSTWREPSNQFAPIGDENGLVIVVPKGRGWFMSSRAAEMFPMRLKIKGNRPIKTSLLVYTLEIKSCACEG